MRQRHENWRPRSNRRQRDCGPTSGCTQRCKHAERPLPVAEEAELSAMDFTTATGQEWKLTSAR